MPTPAPTTDRLDPPPAGRRGRLVRGGVAMIAGQAFNVAVGLGSFAVLARLLSPDDFGLLAMAYVAVRFINSFRDFGLPMAALQSKSLSHEQSTALFWINLPISFSVTLLLIALGPAIAWFFEEPRLVWITLAMAPGVLVPAVLNQHEAILTRRIAFTTLAAWTGIGTFLSSAVAIAMAWAGAGYWALVALFLVSNLTRALAICVLSRWRPQLPGKVPHAFRQVRELFATGAYLTGSRVLAHVSNDMDRVTVGYFGGPFVLGLYEAAWRWACQPVTQILTPLLAPAVAALSPMRDDAAGYRRAATGLLNPVLAVIVPILVFAAVEADGLVLLLLGEQWVEATGIFRVLALGVIGMAVHKTIKWLFVSLGHSRKQLTWGLMSAPVQALLILAAAPFGAIWVAVAFSAGQWLLVLPGLAYCLAGSPLSVGGYLRLLVRPLVAAGIAGGLTFAVARLLGQPAVVELPVTALVFGVAYAVVWLGLPGGRAAAADAWQLLRSVRQGRGVTPVTA